MKQQDRHRQTKTAPQKQHPSANVPCTASQSVKLTDKLQRVLVWFEVIWFHPAMTDDTSKLTPASREEVLFQSVLCHTFRTARAKNGP